MSGFPSNVVRLDDRRPAVALPDDCEPDPAPIPMRRHLRVVRPEASLLRLDTFLARARVVMAETPSDLPAASVVLLHSQPAETDHVRHGTRTAS